MLDESASALVLVAAFPHLSDGALLVIVVVIPSLLGLVGGAVIGKLIRHPLLAALAGGPIAVGLLYGTVFAIAAIASIQSDPNDGVETDWWFLAALLFYPATPAFLSGAVVAGTISTFRVVRASKGR